MVDLNQAFVSMYLKPHGCKRWKICDRVKKLLMDNLVKARDIMKSFTDRHRTERHFQVGDWVLLKLQLYRQSSTRGSMPHKLSSRYYGPYLILEKIGTDTYRLQLPPSAKIHDIFHVSQLKKYEGKEVQIHCNPPSLWEVKPKESKIILERRMVKWENKVVNQILIKWRGEEASDATWEDYYLLKERFPDFNLVYEVNLKGGRVSSSCALILSPTG